MNNQKLPPGRPDGYRRKKPPCSVPKRACCSQGGNPPGDGLASLTEEGTGAGRELLRRIADTARETGSLYEAVRQAGVFPSYMVHMIRIGETAGKLEEVLDSLSLYYEREARLRGAVRSAVLYPLILILLMAAVIAVLVVAVMPIFSSVLADLGAEASANTGMVSTGVVIGRCALVVVAVLLALLVAMLLLSLSAKGRQALMSLSSRLPVLRRLYRQIASSRFASVMSMLLSSGYDLGEALELAEEVVADPTVRNKIRLCRDKVSRGKAFSAALLELGLFFRSVCTSDPDRRKNRPARRRDEKHGRPIRDRCRGIPFGCRGAHRTHSGHPALRHHRQHPAFGHAASHRHPLRHRLRPASSAQTAKGW